MTCHIMSCHSFSPRFASAMPHCHTYAHRSHRDLPSVFTALLTKVPWNRCTGGADAMVLAVGHGEP